MNSLRLDNYDIAPDAISPFDFNGPFSGKPCAGLEVKMTTRTDQERDQLDAIIEKDSIQVKDPLRERAYAAKCQLRSTGYTDGNPNHWYDIELREIDPVPNVDALEIDGRLFSVCKYDETLHGDTVVGKHAVLDLAHDELSIVHSLVMHETVRVRRVGVDDEAVVARFGGEMYWSRTEEGSEARFRQIVRFFPPDYNPKDTGIASATQQDNLQHTIVGLISRTEMLIEMLLEKELLTSQQVDELLQSSLRGMKYDSKREQAFWLCHQVENALELI